MADSTSYPLEISVEEANQLLTQSPDTVSLIDVREPHETAFCRVSNSKLIPMRQIPDAIVSLPRETHLLILCHHGGRSQRVTEFLRGHGFDRVTNVSGGIDAWSERIDPSIPRY